MISLDNATTPTERWVIFCRVIDNLGDAGVTWRLAKQLTREYGLRIDFVIDRPELIPQFESPGALKLLNESISIWHWPTEDHTNSLVPQVGDVTIAAFACHLPKSYRSELAQRVSQGKELRPNYWFNLEYLSAEPWINTCHLLGSSKPEDKLKETFYFPGFTAQSGGLIREQTSQSKDILTRQTLGIQTDSFAISLFCYADAPVQSLLTVLNQYAQDCNRTIELVVTQGVSPELISMIKRTPSNIIITPIDFLPQDHYDQLLALMDLNFVRGEDSLIRAIWAKKPFIWQAYPQDRETQQSKIDHFCKACFAVDSPEGFAGLAHAGFCEWNFAPALSLEILPKLLKNYAVWVEVAQANCDRLSLQSDLAMRLIAASRKI